MRARYVRKAIIGSGIGLLISLLLLLMSHLGTFSLDLLELKDVDIQFKIRSTVESRKSNESKIVLVLIDDDTVKEFPWPWRRDEHGTLLNVLSKSHATVIAYDMFFTDPWEHPEYCAQLAKSMRDGGNVCVALGFKQMGTSEDSVSAEDLRRFSLEAPHEIEGLFPEVTGALKPVPHIISSINSLGHVNALIDADGVTRRFPLCARYKDSLYPSFALRIAGDYFGGNIEVFSDKVVLRTERGDMEIPVDSKGNLLINYWTRKAAFFDTCSAHRLLKHVEERRKLRDKIAIVAATLSGEGHFSPTPIHPSYPTAYIHANMIRSILERDFISLCPAWTKWLITIALGLCTGLSISSSKLSRGVVFALAILGAYVIIASVSFVMGGIALPLFLPGLEVLLIFPSAILFTYIYDQNRSIQSLNHLLDVNRKIIEEMRKGLVIVNREHRVMEFNTYASSITGLRRDEVLYKPYEEAFVELDGFAEIFRRTFEVQRDSSQESFLLTKNGQRYGMVRLSTSFLDDPAEGPKVIMTLTDVDEVVLRDRLASVANFRLGIGHNIIGEAAKIIRPLLSVLDRSDTIGPRERAILRQISESAGRIAELQTRLKHIRHSEGLNCRLYDTNTLVQDAVQYAQNNRTKSDNILADVQLGSGIPETHIDVDAFREALTLVIDNALDAIEEAITAGKVDGTLAVSTETDGKEIRIKVKDTGDGIPEEHQKRIFEPFFTTKETGTGYGLTYAGWVLKKHGGSLSFNTTAGEGAEFWLTLPLPTSSSPPFSKGDLSCG